jgi:hypothetical protein
MDDSNTLIAYIRFIGLVLCHPRQVDYDIGREHEVKLMNELWHSQVG